MFNIYMILDVMTMKSILRIVILVALCIFPAFCEDLVEVYSQIDLLIILDSNEGVSDPNWIVGKQFAVDIASGFTRFGACSFKIAVMNYASTAKIAWNFNSPKSMDNELFFRSIKDLKAIGGKTTSLVDVLNMARTKIFRFRNGDRPHVKNVVILFNQKAAPSEGLEQAAKKLQEIATVVVIGITNYVDKNQLQTIASKPEFVLTLNSFATLRSILQESITEIVSDCHPHCIEGFNNHDINRDEMQITYDITVQFKNKSLPLKVGNKTPVSRNDEICIKSSSGSAFYVSTLCLYTQFVRRYKIIGTNKNGKVVWQTSKQKRLSCHPFPVTKRSMKLINTMCISFIPKKGHTKNMTVSLKNMDGCMEIS